MNVNDLFKASFGQFGSVYLNGDGAKLDLNAANATRFIIAIQFMEDTTFEDIQTLDLQQFIGPLVKSVQQLSAKIDVMQARIDELEG